jgi:hypothetical protein
MQTTKLLTVSALLASLAACGGGGGGGGYAPLPVAQAPAPAPAPIIAAPAPAPAPEPGPSGELLPPPPPPPPVAEVNPPAPAPEPEPEVKPPAPSPAPKTWKDADCTPGVAPAALLSACATNFSDNNASATIMTESGQPAIQLATQFDSVLATDKSKQNGIKGNKAVLGLPLVHKLPLKDYLGISFEAKLGSGTGGDTTGFDDLYVTTTVSLSCDGANWINLVTMLKNMGGKATTDGFTRYSAAPAFIQWYRTGTNPFPLVGTPILYGANGAGIEPLSLEGLKAAYPDACIWNFPNPNNPEALAAGTEGGTTPALDFNLGQSNTLTPKSAWLRGIMVGDKQIF